MTKKRSRLSPEIVNDIIFQHLFDKYLKGQKDEQDDIIMEGLKRFFHSFLLACVFRLSSMFCLYLYELGYFESKYNLL